MTNISIPFHTSQPLSLGVEVELQIIHPQTRDLYPISPDILNDWSLTGPHLKPELFQSMLEIDTPICKSVQEVELELLLTGRELMRLCKLHHAKIASCGTHPFGKWHERLVYPAERYETLLQRNQVIARRLMIYGLHVHLGMKSAEHCIVMMNEFLYYLPHLLALSASSPFWAGHDTGLASSRVTIFEAHPSGGHPCRVNSWNDFENIVDKLMKSKSITSYKDIWWDIRPSPHFGTLELRICDGVPSIRKSARLVAFIHLLARLIEKRLETEGQREPPADWMIRENKWRASRFGLEADILLDNEGNTRSVLEDIRDLIDQMKDDADELGYRQYLEDLQLKDLLNPSYLQQRELFAKHQSLEKLVDFMCEEFENDLHPVST